MANDFNKTARFEHQFWLQILGDHARFIHDSLASQETKEIEIAQRFIETFDHLLASVEHANLIRLSIEAEDEANRIRQFKLDLIKKLVFGKIKIHLSPTFINHMVNEVEEYLHVLEFF